MDFLRRFFSGDLMDHRFESLALLGEGGEGAVELLWDSQLQRQVVCKQLHQPKTKTSAPCSQDVLTVARRLASITCQGVPSVLQLLRREGRVCLLMDYTEGVSLADLRAHNAVEWGDAEILSLALSLARAVRELHQNGVVHADISPGNVLLDHKGGIRLVDFGQAALVGKCLSGAVTPAFSAPESVTGCAAHPAQDVYSIGAILQWLLGPPRAKPIRSPALGLTDSPSSSSPLNANLRRDIEGMLAPLPESRPDLGGLIAQWTACDRQMPASAERQWVADVKTLVDQREFWSAGSGLKKADAAAGRVTIPDEAWSVERFDGAPKGRERSRSLAPTSRFNPEGGPAHLWRIYGGAALGFACFLLLTVMVAATPEDNGPRFTLGRFEVAAVTRLPVTLDRSWLLSRLIYHGGKFIGASGTQGDSKASFELSVTCIGQVCQLSLNHSSDVDVAHQTLVLADSELKLWDGALRDLLRLAAWSPAND